MRNYDELLLNKLFQTDFIKQHFIKEVAVQKLFGSVAKFHKSSNVILDYAGIPINTLISVDTEKPKSVPFIAKIVSNRDNNYVFLELFAFKMIHLCYPHYLFTQFYTKIDLLENFATEPLDAVIIITKA
uniref:Adenine specific DNA methylase Mod n=1 Tax=Lactococcus lactis subsp. lactis TaxID=1360 RepID=A0AAC9W7C6_LACLL